ncbi:MAG: MBOAT family O-acyltransferase [Armatimonadia bacterium]
MVFNSASFLYFLPLAFFAFYFARDSRRWMVLLAASVAFYAVLKAPHLLVALAFVSITAYYFGLGIQRAEGEPRKRLLFWTGVAASLLVLVYARYLPFLTMNANLLLKSLGLDAAIPVPHALISVGVSFYVFQAISYLSDVYLEVQEPETHLGYFALYISFFPKLMQGPIERAGDLLPQLHRKYEFSYDAIRSGLLLLGIGLFKKLILADRFAMIADPIYLDVHSYSGLPLIIGTYAYAFQIFFDFSGYTDMALGVAQLFGIKLTNNFNSPYLATSVPDFWRRWHITFSRWILDYIFKPVQTYLRQYRIVGTVIALFATFFVSGLWHGANWHYVAWGVLHGGYMIASVIAAPYLKKLYRSLKLEKTRALRVWQIVATFNLVCLAWIFFRADGMSDALYVVTHLFSGLPGQVAGIFASMSPVAIVKHAYVALFPGLDKFALPTLIVAGCFMLALQAMDRPQNRRPLAEQPVLVRWAAYYALGAFIIALGNFGQSSFIYFKF